MAFPVIEASNVTADTSGSSVTVNLPTGITVGDLLIVFAAQDGAMLLQANPSNGWTFYSRVLNGTATGLNIYAKIADGSDALTLEGTTDDDVACIAIRVSGHGVTDVATDIKTAATTTGTDDSPNPPSVTATPAQDYLWVEVFAADDDDDTATYWSTNYTGVAQQQSASSTSSCLIAVAYRNLNASSENPGVMLMAASEEWCAKTLAIPPIPPSGILPAMERTFFRGVWSRVWGRVN